MLNLAGWSLRRWLVVVLVVGVLTRLLLWLTYPLTPNNDSPTYIQLARNLLKYGGFSGYNATRSPGYPAFLALTSDWTYFAQLLLGLLTTLLFFYIGIRLSKRAWFGALAALIFTLNCGQLFFEATLLAETLTTFLITGALAATIALTSRKISFFRFLFFSFIAGLAAALAGITRPLFAFMPVFLFVFCFFLFSVPIRQRIAFSIAVAIPASLIFGLWLGFVYNNYKILSFDTIGGYRWLNHTGEYFELVPDQNAAMRDVYLKYRDAKIAETGTQTNAVWDAMDELMAVSGMNFYHLSRELTTISMDLIRAHPGLYFKNVLSGWWMFWWAAVYWSPEALKYPVLIPVIRVFILAERGLMVVSNLAFLVGSLAVVFWKKARVTLAMTAFLWLATASVWAASVVQTLLDHGDNPRYLVPLQALVMMVVAWWLLQLVSKWNLKN